MSSSADRIRDLLPRYWPRFPIPKTCLTRQRCRTSGWYRDRDDLEASRNITAEKLFGLLSADASGGALYYLAAVAIQYCLALLSEAAFARDRDASIRQNPHPHIYRPAIIVILGRQTQVMN